MKEANMRLSHSDLAWLSLMTSAICLSQIHWAVALGLGLFWFGIDVILETRIK